jgi:predicted dehydrogenase
MLRVGMIVAGSVAKSHLAALRCLDEARLAAIYDPIKERAAYLARPWGAAVCDSPDEVIDRTEAVWVCTPTGERRGPAVAAARADRHLLLDKPIAATLEEARAIVEATDAGNGKCMVCFSMRFAG